MLIDLVIKREFWMETQFLAQSLNFSAELPLRPRRNRKSSAVRALVQENHLLPQQLVAPLFIIEGNASREIISSMPGVERLSIDLLIEEVQQLYKLGIRAIDLFPVILKEKKDPFGQEAVHPDNLVFRAIKAIKQAIPEMCIMVDVALDPFTSHGHDGIVDEKGVILNDPTLHVLGEMSLLAAQAGADVIAPSDMMDGRVGHIRRCLDAAGFIDVSILSYAAKYASSFYGPFREALHSAPQFGDKKSYQMNPANSREALLEASLDVSEGADMLMIKPALSYLDIVYQVRQATHLPLGAYHVSGEYAMVMAAAEKGWLDADKVFMESLISIRRAGADFILTYAAKRVAKSLLS
jgi:porphobilinogen synthase